MNRFLSVACLCALVLTSCSSRESAEGNFVTAPNARLGSEYPQVDSEGRVRVHIHTPYAISVKLDIDGVKYRLRRSKGGDWVGESAPLDEGFHYYQLHIDGTDVPDPSSVYYYGAGRWGSGVDVPSPDDAFFELRNVPQGQLRGTYYWSEEKQAMRHIFVYTPPEYDKHPEKRYPVLYLLPGGAENEYSWTQQGHIAQIMDNLIAEGRAEPFIVVMDKAQLDDVYGWEEDYSSILLNDLMPMVDAEFRTVPDSAHRAMAGLSYGGLQVKWTALAHPEAFSALGIFSGYTITPDDVAGCPGFAENNRLLFVSYGSKELDSPIFGIDEGTDPRKETEDLKPLGINSVFYVSPRTHHEWHSWRRSLHEFAQLLFK